MSAHDQTLTLSELTDELLNLASRCSQHTPTGVHAVRYSPNAPGLGEVVLEHANTANYDKAIELLEWAEDLLDPDTTITPEERASAHSKIRDFLDA